MFLIGMAMNLKAEQTRKSQIAIESAYWARTNFLRCPHSRSTEVPPIGAIRRYLKSDWNARSQISRIQTLINRSWPKPGLRVTSLGKWLMIIDNADNSEVFFKPDKC